MEDIKKIVESLNPDERVILPYLNEKEMKAILKKSGLDETRVLRALQFLENKGILRLKSEESKLADLGDNGVVYLKNGLPERRLLNILAEFPLISLKEAKEKSKLSENEFKAAIGALRKKVMIELKGEKINLAAKKEEIIKKSLEEQLLDSLPLVIETMKPEQKLAFELLKNRKDIVIIKQEKKTEITLTDLGKSILKFDINSIGEMIETLTPEIILSGEYKGKKFRRYDIKSRVPEINGGKKHFVNQSIDYARRVWTELGFKEMDGNLIQTGFWDFDALFTAQDHPVREMQDTFYIKDIKGKLPDKELVSEIKKSHESGVGGSTGWKYHWKEEEAKKVLMRTHTTVLSAKTLTSLRNLKEKKGKFFAIGKCFRNETIDWSHGFEFNQTEGIVIDKNANLRHLFGYLKEFYKKMGFNEVKFVPSYFPYTEPSLEIYAWNNDKKVWIEIGGAGIFRPEVVIPLLGEYIPVLAWGPGFDRALMNYYGIKDLRELYKNDINQLRKIKFWIK
ncbi:phenylalanine--tRNA ligase subunit alpha [Candidatus Pacearchaeota archaeon]|nr:phenylalanine--tRNA ligase subunit alpha [Candidatus Pacearchaeota archaeon]